MTFKEFIVKNKIKVEENNQPVTYSYSGTELSVSVSDMERLYVMKAFLEKENTNLTNTEFFAMLKVCPKYLKTAKKYPYADFVKELKDHGPKYIAIAISNRTILNAKEKEVNTIWNKMAKKHDKQAKNLERKQQSERVL